MIYLKIENSKNSPIKHGTYENVLTRLKFLDSIDFLL